MSAITLRASSSRRTRIDQPSPVRICPSGVPTPTVKTRTPRAAASRAASTGSGPVVVWPSVRRMTTADLYEPGGTGFGSGFSGAPSGRALPPAAAEPPAARSCWLLMSKSWSGKMAFRETMMPLPIAVAFCSCSWSIALSTSSRLRVGGCIRAALPAKLTTPMRVVDGVSLMNARAAVWAAARRVGFTSSARMLPETSMARITVSCCDGSVIVVAGRASATSIRVSAPRSMSGGTWRRKLTRLPSASRTSAKFEKASAVFLRRRRMPT